MTRHQVLRILVDRAWPLAIACYSVFAAITTVNARGRDETFVIYAYEQGHWFAAIAYYIVALFALLCFAAPRWRMVRWAFFFAAGFVLIGRIASNLSYAQGDSTPYRLTRTSLTAAALIAHVVIQIDYSVYQANDG